MATAVSVNTEFHDAAEAIGESVTNFLYLAVLGVALAHPLAWLWNNVLVGLFTVLGPVGPNFWASAATVATVLLVLQLVGLVERHELGFNLVGIWDVVGRALPVWLVFVAAWAVQEYLV